MYQGNVRSLVCWLRLIGSMRRLIFAVDMATPYDAPIPDEQSEFSSLRDSFFILMNLNQYKMKPVISMTKEAEGLLRIVLFSEELTLLGSRRTLSQLRAKLARDLRRNRRRGVVPIFISTLWFLLALGISIEAGTFIEIFAFARLLISRAPILIAHKAFSDIGSNVQAHNLAMGLFVAWFPVLILCSILDRNPMASDDIQRKLNKIVDIVCMSLQDEMTRHDYIASFHRQPQAAQMAYWVEKISTKTQYIQHNYFCGFAGQARTRFHYGAAYAILADIEKAYIAEKGRNWLADHKTARACLVLGRVDHGLTWFDGRQLWRVWGSFFLVGGTGLGAFLLSFHTPTVGLGCRTVGYLVFFVVTFALLIAEILVWWLTSPLRKHTHFDAHLNDYTTRVTSGIHHTSKRINVLGLASSKAFLRKTLNLFETIVKTLILTSIRLLPLHGKLHRLRTAETLIHNHFKILRDLTTRNWLQRVVFTPVEFANMVWLCYLHMAQTVGAFNNCACMSSSWGRYGGYLDFTQVNQADSPKVAQYWVEGTIITCVFMGSGMAYIIAEVCSPWFSDRVCTDETAVATSSASQHRELQRRRDRSRARATVSPLHAVDLVPV
jgi:hypothetical protein